MDKLSKDSLINFDFSKTHFIGYDLGAHVVNSVAQWYGESANYLQPYWTNRIDRITGLDPAGMFQFGGFIFQYFGVNSIKRSTAW